MIMNKYDKNFSGAFRDPTIHRAAARSYIESVVGKLNGKKVLDVGCGSGYFSRILTAKGAKVVGIDNSKYQIEIARSLEMKRNSGIDYRISDAKKFKNTAPEKFDIVLMSFFLLELPKKGDVIKCLRSANDVLEKNGTLILSEVHPHFINKSIEGTSFFMKNNKRYFDNGALLKAQTKTISGKKISFLDTHYTLEFLLNSLIECGFSIERVKEIPYFKERCPIGIVIVTRKVMK